MNYPLYNLYYRYGVWIITICHDEYSEAEYSRCNTFEEALNVLSGLRVVGGFGVRVL